MIKYLWILLVIVSCVSPQELYIRKREKAKEKIDKLTRLFPEIVSKTDTTIIIKDTIINDKIVVVSDTIITNKIKIDTLYKNIKTDTTLHFSDKSNVVKGIVQIKQDGVLVNITKYPEIIYRNDTINMKDTIYTERIITKYKEVINTNPSMWFVIWSNIKDYLWFILVVIGVILVYRLTK